MSENLQTNAKLALVIWYRIKKKKKYNSDCTEVSDKQYKMNHFSWALEISKTDTSLT